METNWMHVGLMAGAVYAAVLAACLVRRRWTWAGLGVALSNAAYVALHLVAPFRGVLDPGYAGYRAGLFDVPAGPWVTLVTGAIVLGALAAACIALLARQGPAMAVIAVVDALLLLTIGLPEAVDGLRAPHAYRIELGEYLQVPGLLAVAIGVSLFCLPLVASIVWSVRRLRLPATPHRRTVLGLCAGLVGVYGALGPVSPPAAAAPVGPSVVHDDLHACRSVDTDGPCARSGLCRAHASAPACRGTPWATDPASGEGGSAGPP